MKILPIDNNISTKTTFMANFSRQDVIMLLKEVSGKDEALMPKLYTLLEYLRELGGKEAKIFKSKKSYWNQLYIDKKPVNFTPFIKPYTALYASLVEDKHIYVEKSCIKRMPESIFEKKWWENRNKTVKDVIEFGV